MDLQKKKLFINGIERSILCNEEKDTLAAVIRRMGLTGTKVGCGQGQCGACTVLLNGVPVRSCIRKMRAVKDGAQVETVEGLGRPGNLHPLQQAFITYAAIQCGFCTSGFLMSSKALLDQNDNPSRAEVREWFAANKNICRCTGYIPLVDAVMAAAAVLRGEKSMEDITFRPPADGILYGSAMPKPSGESIVLGQMDFGADLALQMPRETLHLAVVMAYRHHARLTELDYTAAEKMPGVRKVITAKDVKGSNRLFNPQGSVRCYTSGKERPVICEDTVFRWGDVVAVVAASTREQARDAAKVVRTQYEDLPAILSFPEAASNEAPAIHPGSPNIYLEQPFIKGESTEALFRQSAFSVKGSFKTSRQPHLAIEPDVVQAYPDGEGVVIHCKTQFLYGNIACMADAIGLPKDKIRIVLNPAGGSFGYSMSPAAYALAATCALAVDAPISLEFSWPEHQHFSGKRAPIFANAELACDEKGRFTAMSYNVGVDHGAYSDMAGALTSKIGRFFGYPYQIPNIRGLVRTAFTNHNFGVAYRAFGSPQAYTVSEQLVDMLADTIGMDPFELRYLNVARPGDVTTTSVPYREYPMESIMDAMRPHYEEARKRARKEHTPERMRGVGLAFGGYHVGKAPDRSEVDIELNPDGSVTHYSCWADVGQGADIGAFLHAHTAMRSLGLKPEQIHLVRNDTKLCPDTGSASGSRSHHCAGLATIDAARQLLDAMRKDDGTFRSYEEMTAQNIPTRYRGVFDSMNRWPDLDPNTGHGWGAVAQNYCLFLAEVEVEATTGLTQVLGVTVVLDVGKVGSLHGVNGQVWGGFAHSIGYALSEDYDDVKRHATLLGAGIKYCTDTPDKFVIIHHETLRDDAPYGSTGCAEACQSSGHVAILNAISNATGVRCYTLPAAPDKLLAAIRDKAAGKEPPQPAWDLGCDLYERLAYLAAHPKL